LTVEEAATYLACAPKRIYELKAQGRIAHFRDGKRLLFRREDLDAALRRREAK
jgi:excisionase family DNA binding protein